MLKIQARECPEDPDCPSKIYAEGIQLATQLERQVQTSLGGLEALLRALEKIPGRKAVVLVSAGLLVSDRSARPAGCRRYRAGHGPDGGARERVGLHRSHRHDARRRSRLAESAWQLGDWRAIARSTATG